MKLPKRVYERTGLRWVFARPRDLVTEPFLTVRPPLRVTIWAQSIVLVLGLLLGALFAADLASQVINASGLIDPNLLGWRQLSRMLDLNAEASFATWYQVIALVFLSLLLASIGLAKRQTGDLFARHWLLLALLALGFSLDEQVQLHDPGGGTDTIRESLGLGGPMFYGWVIIGLLSALVVGLYYRHFLMALPQTTRRLYALAAALFVGGEIVLEILSGWYADLSGSESDLMYLTITSFEEFFGMAGILVAIAATLQLAQTHFGAVRVALHDGLQAAVADTARPPEPAPDRTPVHPEPALELVPAGVAPGEARGRHE
jgi:hypothetical protein